TGHPDFQNLLRARALARQKGELVPVRYELKIVTKAGEERWLGFTEGVFEFEGTPAVVSIAFDITERQRAEEALRKSERLLREAHRHHRAQARGRGGARQSSAPGPGACNSPRGCSGNRSGGRHRSGQRSVEAHLGQGHDRLRPRTLGPEHWLLA